MRYLYILSTTRWSYTFFVISREVTDALIVEAWNGGAPPGCVVDRRSICRLVWHTLLLILTQLEISNVSVASVGDILFCSGAL